MAGYRKIDDMTVAVSSTRPAELYFPYMLGLPAVHHARRAWEAAGRD
jgi:hypothetical protein